MSPTRSNHTLRVLGLVDAAEEELLREAGHLLHCDLSIVRTRKEFEDRTTPGKVLVIGDDQSRSQRISTVRRARKRYAQSVIAAIANDLVMKVELLEAGASLVVSLADPAGRLASGIEAAQEGECPLNSAEAAAVVHRLQHLSNLCVDEGVDVDRCEQLTRREREVAALLGARKSNDEIARGLGIAVGTVKTHVHNILDKLDVEDRGLAGVYWRVFDEKRGLRR